MLLTVSFIHFWFPSWFILIQLCTTLLKIFISNVFHARLTAKLTIAEFHLKAFLFIYTYDGYFFLSPCYNFSNMDMLLLVCVTLLVSWISICFFRWSLIQWCENEKKFHIFCSLLCFSQYSTFHRNVFFIIVLTMT